MRVERLIFSKIATEKSRNSPRRDFKEYDQNSVLIRTLCVFRPLITGNILPRGGNRVKYTRDKRRFHKREIAAQHVKTSEKLFMSFLHGALLEAQVIRRHAR